MRLRQGKEDRARGEGDVVVDEVVVDGGDECDCWRRKSGMRDRVGKGEEGHSEKTTRKKKGIEWRRK